MSNLAWNNTISERRVRDACIYFPNVSSGGVRDLFPTRNLRSLFLAKMTETVPVRLCTAFLNILIYRVRVRPVYMI